MAVKYGFVYIWFDRKHKRYYIGSHWGTETDGYICSSDWMRRAYNRRPSDFKRRILATTDERPKTRELEQQWMNLMKPEEMRIRYYNLCLSTKNPWHDHPDQRLTVGQKISAKKLGKSNGRHTEETKNKISTAKIGTKFSAEHKAKLSEAHAGRKSSEERKAQISQHLKEQYADGRRVAKKKPPRKLYAPGEKQKLLWADPVWAENQRQKLKEGSARRHGKT